MTHRVFLCVFRSWDHLSLHTEVIPETLHYRTGLCPGPSMTLWLDGCGSGYHYRTVFEDHPIGSAWTGLEVVFDAPCAALMFKLTWG